MTNQEAIESFKHSNKQAKQRLEVEKMRMDISEVKELEFYIERDDMAIKALEQTPILDKIRTEIEETYMNITYQENKDSKATQGLRKALQIIDKYKAESEDRNE